MKSKQNYLRKEKVREKEQRQQQRSTNGAFERSLDIKLIILLYIPFCKSRCYLGSAELGNKLIIIVERNQLGLLKGLNGRVGDEVKFVNEQNFYLKLLSK